MNHCFEQINKINQFKIKLINSCNIYIYIYNHFSCIYIYIYNMETSESNSTKTWFIFNSSNGKKISLEVWERQLNERQNKVMIWLKILSCFVSYKKKPSVIGGHLVDRFTNNQQTKQQWSKSVVLYTPYHPYKRGKTCEEHYTVIRENN